MLYLNDIEEGNKALLWLLSHEQSLPPVLHSHSPESAHLPNPTAIATKKKGKKKEKRVSYGKIRGRRGLHAR